MKANPLANNDKLSTCLCNTLNGKAINSIVRFVANDTQDAELFIASV